MHGREGETVDSIKRIMALSDAFGPPGFEEEVARLVKDEMEELYSVSCDTMNNVYLNLTEKQGLRIQLDAHMDEVGFMVSKINKKGMLGLHPLGGWVEANLPSQNFILRNHEGEKITGIVASTPPHFLSDEKRKKGPTIENMVLDLGASSLEEVEALGVGIGNPMVPDVTCRYMEDRNLFLGKAFDCRLGVAALLETMERLHDQELPIDVVGALSTQEEGGLRGAQVTARRVEPDLAIVFEGCPADDSFLSPPESQTRLGEGPMLRHVDKGMTTHPGFQRFALKLAKEKGIPHQEAVRSGGSTNGAPIHLSGQGVPVIVIGIPVRYIHSHYGYARQEDYEAAVELAVQVITSLSEEVYHSFKPF